MPRLRKPVKGKSIEGMTDTIKTARGTIARTAVQCKSGNSLGDFLYTGDSPADESARVSPMFVDLVGLYEWAHANYWMPEGGAHVYRP